MKRGSTKDVEELDRKSKMVLPTDFEGSGVAGKAQVPLLMQLTGR